MPIKILIGHLLEFFGQIFFNGIVFYVIDDRSQIFICVDDAGVEPFLPYRIIKFEFIAHRRDKIRFNGMH